MAKSKAFTVALVEDDAALRASWGQIVNRFANFTCVGDFSSGEAALEGIPKLRPDIVLMDINLPGISGIECTQELKKRLPELEILMLTMFGDRDNIFDALRAGAGGYLLKRSTPAELQAALVQAIKGGAPMSPQIARQVVVYFQKPAATPEVEALTERESEILRLLSAGGQYKQIGEELGMRLDTVRTHIKRIYQKLHVHSRTEAVVKFLDQR
jgi:DNA-binding NarL/FixJ family response regulator